MNKDIYNAHSIWLISETQFAVELQHEINRLSEGRQVPTFSPHVTLLGELSGPPELSIHACETCFTANEPITARVAKVSNSDAFFMSLFLDLELEPDISMNRLRLAEMVNGDIRKPFRPHLSLAYGWENGPPRQLEAERLNRKYVGRTFQLTHLIVALSAKSIPIENWREVRRLQLSSST